jgi:hypothetical protein
MIWRVLNSSRYRVYQPVLADNGEMRAAVLLRVDEDGTPTGDFRVALGGEAVRVEIWSNDLFDHKPLKGFHLVLHHDVDDIDLRCQLPDFQVGRPGRPGGKRTRQSDEARFG